MGSDLAPDCAKGKAMLKNARTGAFVAVTDRARAKAFYGGTLGLPLVHEDDFALVFDSFGTRLRVSPVKALTPQAFTVLGWEVPDIRAAVAELAGNGVEFLRVPGLPQDDLGIWSPAPGVFVAWFKDP